jgi:N,N'-diacetyllegionaminate synthase
METVSLKQRLIGVDGPCFVIAEAGVNHNGDLKLARQLIDVAVEAGAEAVKFQTFKAGKVVSYSAPKAAYQLQTTDQAESQYEMLRKLELPYQAHRKLKDYCQERDILFMSTPFDEESADFLESLGVEVFKIGSGEITNIPLLEHIAGKQKPIILSTGMSTLVEVGQAVQVIRAMGNDQVVLLQCVSNYPADPRDVNLRAMRTMATAFQVPVGYSDHTPGIEVALAAVALGACVIEKHFTLDRTLPGPDQQASIEPDELKALVRGIRTVESALGHGRKEPAASEANTRAIARRSLVAACDLPAGTKLSLEHIAIRRPGTGLPPLMRPYLVGLSLREAVFAGTLFTMEMFT